MELNGTIREVTDSLRKLWCRMYKIEENKFIYVGYNILNDIKVLDENGHKYIFWAGSSGCNWNLLDSTGGNHMCSNTPNKLITAFIPDEWIEKTKK